MNRPVSVRLRVDPIACDAFGYCIELLPELVRADEWGYPVIDEAEVPPHLRLLAERAVRDCPRRALSLESAARQRA
jgi:ferredoxin